MRLPVFSHNIVYFYVIYFLCGYFGYSNYSPEAIHRFGRVLCLPNGPKERPSFGRL